MMIANNQGLARIRQMLQVALQHDDGYQNQILYNPLRLKRFTALTPKVIAITSLYSPERRRVERFLEREFRVAYSARISRHYPTLMSVQDDEGTILGALGFRYASEEPLFLEQYLDTPVDAAITQVRDRVASRNEIVEVGNLASRASGASIFLFTALTAYLQQQNMQYITVTATDFLHRYFTRLGIAPAILGHADQTRLPDKGQSWGSYYQTMPRILVGGVGQSYEKLQRYLQVSLVDETVSLRTRLHYEATDGR
jgi:hypothetical protein